VGSDLHGPKRTTKRRKAPPVYRNAFSFAGVRGKEDLGQRDKLRPGCPQKGLRGKARRERLQIFRGSGLVTRWCAAGIEGGALSQCVSPSLDPVGPRRFPEASLAGGTKVYAFYRTSSARCGWLASLEADIAQTRGNEAP